MGRDTVRLPSVDAPKKESNKTLWVTLVTGVLSLATAVSVAIIQTGSASEEDVDKITKKNDTSFGVLVTQINEHILPRIERNQDLQNRKLDRLSVRLLEENAQLRERLARLEERVGIREGTAITRMFEKPTTFFDGEEDLDPPDEDTAPPEPKQQKLPRLSF